MKTFQKILILTVCLLPLLLLGERQSRRPVTPEDIVNIRDISDSQISPDGKWVAFVVTEPADTSKPELPRNSDIWIVFSNGSAPPRKYAFGPKKEFMPRWSPNGKYLAFLSNRGEDEKNQIHLMYTNGGEAEHITRVKEGVVIFKWNSDTKSIAFTSKDSLTSREKKQSKLRDDERVLDEDFKYIRLYEIDLESQEITLISQENENINDFDYSPDCNKVCMLVSANPKLDEVFYQSKLVLIKRDGSGRKVISEKSFGNVRWSPNGKQLLHFAPIGEGIASLPCLTSSNGSKRKLLAEEYHGTIWEIDWFPNSKSLLVSSQEGVQGIIGKLNTKSGKVKRLAPVGRPFGGNDNWSINANGEWIAFINASSTSAKDVWIMKSNGSGIKCLTNMNPQVSSLSFGSQEPVQWRSKDGTLIEGVLIKPVNYEKGRKYPLIVQIHGGPRWAWWNGWLVSWHEWAQLLASNGYAVLLPNIRGSDGYGWKFVEKNLKDWGGGDFEDIMSGVDYLIKEGIVDSEKIGIGGWSYGGFMTSWVVSQTGRFKAAIMGAGLSNLISMYGTTDIPSIMKLYFGNYPYNTNENYEKSSALTFIKNVRTPTLILHGEEDVRVPISQAYEFYKGLRDMGIETQFIIYPRESHGIKEHAHQLDLVRRVLDWYDCHLKNQ